MREISFEEQFCISMKRYVEERSAIEGKGFISRLAKELGISQGHLSNIIAGRKIGTETQRRFIADKLGLDYDFMIGNNKRKYIELSEIIVSKAACGETKDPFFNIPLNTKKENEMSKEIYQYYRIIPLYESLRFTENSNGVEILPLEDSTSIFIVSKSELKEFSNRHLLAFRIIDDSMKPTIQHDSIVVVALENRDYFDRKIYLVAMKHNGEMIASVRRVRKWKSGFILVSDNPDYPPEPTTSDWNAFCVGRVVWQCRNIMDS